MIDRDAKCLRCGSTLPVVTVQVAIIKTHRDHWQAIPVQEITGYREVEEHGDCIRCNGAS